MDERQIPSTIPAPRIGDWEARLEADDTEAGSQVLKRVSASEASPEHLPLVVGSPRTRAAKRFIDIVTAAVVFVVTAPIALVVALLIKLEDGGPTFFRQQRLGLHGEPFTLHKFRSMRVDAEAATGPTWAQENDPRVTRVGRWLRALRIDELPQLWNVLRGDMSLVGPRPERTEFVAMLRAAMPLYDHRHLVRPGISGWAQVNLPHRPTVEDARRKLEYDLYYLKNFSLHLDWLIMRRTIKIILFGWRSPISPK